MIAIQLVRKATTDIGSFPVKRASSVGGNYGQRPMIKHKGRKANSAITEIGLLGNEADALGSGYSILNSDGELIAA